MAIKIGTGTFKERIDKGIHDDFMRGAVASAQNGMAIKRKKAADELGNWEEWRLHGEEIRKHVLENLDYYLEQLSDNVAKRGGHVFFAQTAEDATNYIKEVVKKKNAKKIVKSKSMVTEEIGLNEALQDEGCEVIETDLGEFILQIDHDRPSHILGPALHKNREQIREVFAEKLGYTKSSKPEEMAAHVRGVMRKHFLSADLGITGCNFAVAETGSFSLVTNEGNGDLVTSIPKTQITVMGMERIVPTFEELDTIISLLTRNAVGQKLSSYFTLMTGPREELESDGPEEFHLVIVDNGRSDILGTDFQAILQCIRCAACLNVCPVYRQIGGHAYGSIYQGPIGSVLSPLLGGYDDFKELPYASSLCGACSEVCPVRIPLHELLRKHRQVIVEKEGKAPFSEKIMMKAFGLGASSPTLYKMASKMAPAAMSPFTTGDKITKGPGPLKSWTDIRNFPAPDKEKFRDWFNNRHEGGKQK